MRTCGLLLLLLFSFPCLAQDEVLLSINGESIGTDEFLYTFTKNQKGPTTKADVDEYLQLYINYKLKVQEARKLGFDTIPSYQRELAEYLDQLTQPYLTEKEVTEQLIEEGFDRLQEEVAVSHILLRLPANPTPDDTLRVYHQIMDIYQIATPLNFDSLAVQYSEEPGVDMSKGYLGYFTAFQMVYPFENMAYSTSAGQISLPVRTQFGYHLVYVRDRRSSRGKVQISHIMQRLSGNMSATDSVAKEEKIWEIYLLAMDNYNWETLVSTYSEDANTREKGGVINPFGVGEMIPSIAEAAFSLDTIGQISDPVQSPFGWHLLRLENRIPPGDFESMQVDIERKVKRDSRSNKSKEVLISRLKKENEYSENTPLCSFLRSLNQQMNELPDSISSDEQIATVGNQILLVSDFNTYLRDQPSNAVNVQFETFLSEQIIAYEKGQLAAKYPEYSYLRNEYEEGILLFDIMTAKIWNPASNDSSAIQAYYDAHTLDYQQPEEITISLFVGSEHDRSIFAFLTESLADSLTLPGEKEQMILDKFPDITLSKSGTFIRGDCSDDLFRAEGIHELEDGSWLAVWQHSGEEALPLEKVKGQVIADYQDQMDKEWVESLRKGSKISIRKKELKRVYRTVEN